MNLQQLRDKEVTVDRLYNANCINLHVEDTILHMLQNNIEIEPENDWDEVATEMIKDNDDGNQVYLNYTEAQVKMIEGLDIWLVIDYSVRVWWDGESEPEMEDIDFDRIKCYWMDMEFDLTWSQTIAEIIRGEIKNW